MHNIEQKGNNKMMYHGCAVLEVAINDIEADSLEDATKKATKIIISKYKVKKNCFNLFMEDKKSNK